MKFAIVFTVEKSQGDMEKMSVLLSTSIRQHMPNVDVYCGLFTQNYLSDSIVKHLNQLNVNLVVDQQFEAATPPFNVFLRAYTKYYFSNLLLGQYDYLIYLDVDTLLLKSLSFDFDPTDKIILVDQMPDWVKSFEGTYTKMPSSNVYYSWIDIINKHNKYLYDLDYTSKEVQYGKNSDFIISKMIDESPLQKIQQTIGAYHCLHPLTLDSQVIHYDDFGKDGSLINLKKTHPDTYNRYDLLLKRVLGVININKEGLWESRMKQYS